jgi:hypothetical protein
MTISTTTNRVSFAGNGSTTAFATGFKFFANGDLVVTLVTDSTGAEVVKTITTHYSVTGAGVVTGGTVTMVTAPATGETLVIVRAQAYTQGLDLVENDPFPSESVEDQLDKNVIMAQQNDSALDRSLRQPAGDTADIDFLPPKVTRATKALGFDADGDPTVSTLTLAAIESGATDAAASAVTAASEATAAAASAVAAAASETAAGVSEAAAASYASPVTETFADTVGFTAGTSTTITLAATVVEDAVIITFDGVTQHHDTYSISGTTVTFTSTIPVGVLAIEASYGTRSTGAIDNIIIGANTPAAGSFTTVNGVTPATAQYTTTLNSKLNGIEALADVTDATNVTAAGALMDSELTSIASVKALNQGVATTDTPTFAGIITSGNVDGRDVSVDGTKLDGIEAAADVTDSTNVLASLVGQEVVATGFTGTLDGVLGGGTPAAVNGTTLTASGNAIVDNLGTGGISPVRDLHVSNAGTNVFAQWTNNTTGHTDTDGWLSGMPNGTDFRYYGYEVGGVFTFYPEETLSLTVAKLGVTVAGTLSAGATDVTTLTASGEIAGTSGVAISGGTANTSVDIALPNTNFLAWYDAAATGATTAYIQGSGGAITVNGSSLTFSGGNSDFLANNITTTGTLSAGATTVTTLTASGDVAINTDTLLVDVSTETIGVKMTPDVLGAPLQIKHDGTVAYLGLNGGNSDTEPFLSTWQDPDPASALFGWSFFNRSTDGNLRLSRRNNSTTDTEVLTIARSDGAATFAGTLSAGATTVAGLTSSGHITVGAVLGMRSSETNQLTYVSGGTGINDGANMLLYGQAHATQAYDITFRGNVGVVLQYDESAAKWDFQAKTLQTTAGVYIGGSAAANLLDDYEEGTWTPAISGDGTAGTYTNGTTQATYTKIGRMVTVNFGIGSFSTATGGTGNLRITGLPFTKTAGQSPTGSVWFSSVNTGASVISLALVFSTAAGASATLNVNEVVDNAVVQLTPISGVGVSSQIHGSITYFV